MTLDLKNDPMNMSEANEPTPDTSNVEASTPQNTADTNSKRVEEVKRGSAIADEEDALSPGKEDAASETKEASKTDTKKKKIRSRRKLKSLEHV